MASVGHLVVGLAAGRLHSGRQPSAARLAGAMLGLSVLSVLPDLDVVGFKLGVPYAHAWGHRGASHSLAIALAGGVLVGLVVRALRGPALKTGLLAALVLASHGLLDTLTTGGLGVALLWPLSQERFFAPWRILPVAPLGLGALSIRGLHVVAAELLYTLPLLLYALLPRWPRRQRLRLPDPPG